MPGPAVTGKWLVAIVVSLTPTSSNIMVQVTPGELVEYGGGVLGLMWTCEALFVDV